MAETTILRETKIGQKGFVKEDVMTYIDELNSKIVSLEDEIKKGTGANNTDPQELVKYRNQIDNLQEKLNASNNALRAAKKEVEELQKQRDNDQKLIAQFKAGGSGASAAAVQANVQQAQALEAAKKEIDKLNAQLKEAQIKAASASQAGPNAAQQAQQAQALDAARKEIDKLKAQLKNTQAGAPAAPAQASPANSEELVRAKQEIAKITNELNAKAKELADKDNMIAQLKNDSANAAKVADAVKAKDADIAQKNAEIQKLNSEIKTLKEANSDPTAQMGLIFAEAQKTVSMLKSQAKIDADKTTNEANEKAEKILTEANEKAEKTVATANTTAAACIKEANEQAKATVNDANKQADKVNEMTTKVRTMLLNEIESVNNKFNDITSVLNRLTGQATDRMSEAQLIIGEAKKAVGDKDAPAVKKADAPKVDFKATEAPKASVADYKANAAKAANDDPFAAIGSAGTYPSASNAGLNNSGSSYNNNNNKHAAPAPAPTPAPAPAAAPQAKPAPKKSAFSFDMEELLKAAEEEAAKNPES